VPIKVGTNKCPAVQFFVILARVFLGKEGGAEWLIFEPGGGSLE
jgi:hypothetical protein